MRYAELDLEQGNWLVPRERAKNGIANLVPLSPLAAQTSKGLSRKPGKAGYAFTTTGKTSVSGWTRAKTRRDAAMAAALIKERVLAEGEDPAHWVLHDLRRTAATLMAKRKVAPDVIEAVLNHKSGKVSGIFIDTSSYRASSSPQHCCSILMRVITAHLFAETLFDLGRWEVA